MLSFMWDVIHKTSYVSDMSSFDYAASAGLFAVQGRSGLRYRRFDRAAEAIRYAIEKLPPKALSGTSLEVNDARYSAAEIRALYESERYPLSRKDNVKALLGYKPRDNHAIASNVLTFSRPRDEPSKEH
jgi:hypothetical protein